MFRRIGIYKRIGWTLVVVLPACVAAVVFWAGQKVAVKRVVDAFERQDRAAIAAYVNFDAVRRSVQEQVVADSGGKQIVANEMAEAVNRLVTPDSLPRVLSWRGGPPRLSTPELLSFRRFRVRSPDSSDLTFCRIGILEWEVCSLVLSRAALDAIVRSSGRLAPGKPERQALSQVVEIRGVALQYAYVNQRCPQGIRELVASRLLAREHSIDPWGTDLSLRCNNVSEIEVISAGPDHQLGTSDDISFP